MGGRQRRHCSRGSAESEAETASTPGKNLPAEASFQLAEHATDDALTPAEISILRLIAEGNANKQIADQLSITEGTERASLQLSANGV